MREVDEQEVGRSARAAAVREGETAAKAYRRALGRRIASAKGISQVRKRMEGNVARANPDRDALITAKRRAGVRGQTRRVED